MTSSLRLHSLIRQSLFHFTGEKNEQGAQKSQPSRVKRLSKRLSAYFCELCSISHSICLHCFLSATKHFVEMLNFLTFHCQISLYMDTSPVGFVVVILMHCRKLIIKTNELFRLFALMINEITILDSAKVDAGR